MSTTTDSALAEAQKPVTAGDLVRESTDAGSVAGVGRTDAVSSGLVVTEDRYASEVSAPIDPLAASRRSHKATARTAASPEDKKLSIQRGRHIGEAIADAVADELDDSDELEGTASAWRGTKEVARSTRSIASRVRSRRSAAARQAKRGTSAAKMKSRRSWLASREAARHQTKATAKAAAGGKAAAATASSTTAAPVLGVIAGIVCFVLSAIVISQAVSSLFGFWENEQRKQAVAGLPPYISVEMVEAALQCQQDYGHPAGCTLAQIIVESGKGDHLSGLATRDNNLFGIKWSSSFASAPEVDGKDSWGTSEEYGGQKVSIMADFARFKSMKDCIVFRSRVLLQHSRYAENALIRAAIAEHDSDKMADGLKEAGYATSSDYVDSLKSAMDTYGLRRFDSMTLEDFKNGRASGVSSASGNVIVDAAYSQLGVPYVWGGMSPGSQLDCSGLTKYCYSCAGIELPHSSTQQADGGTRIPLSEAQPGDILWKPGHVAIYIGGDEYIHEPHSGDVCKKSSGVSYFTCAIRY